MAQAVKRLFPNTKLGIGPAIDNGFYYDFKVEKPFDEEEYLLLEKRYHKFFANCLCFGHLSNMLLKYLIFSKTKCIHIEIYQLG